MSFVYSIFYNFLFLFVHACNARTLRFAEENPSPQLYSFAKVMSNRQPIQAVNGEGDINIISHGTEFETDYRNPHAPIGGRSLSPSKLGVERDYEDPHASTKHNPPHFPPELAERDYEDPHASRKHDPPGSPPKLEIGEDYDPPRKNPPRSPPGSEVEIDYEEPRRHLLMGIEQFT